MMIFMDEETQIQLNDLRQQIENLSFEQSRKLGSSGLTSRGIADRFVARKAGLSGA